MSSIQKGTIKTKRKNVFFTTHEFIHEKAGMKKNCKKHTKKKEKKIQNKSLVLVV